MINFLMTVAASGIFSRASSQLSAPEPLYLRGCRAPRGQFAHEGYCDQYYNCWDGRATIEECPGELLFNPVTSTCDYPQAVNCGGRVRKQGPRIISGRCQKRWGTFADPLDCSTFYECDNFVAHWKRCPYYTAFDEHLLVCVHAYDVDCAGRGGVHGTYAPPVFRDAAGPASARIGSPSGGLRSGQDRRQPQHGSPSGSSSSGSASGSSSSDPASRSPSSGLSPGSQSGSTSSSSSGSTSGSSKGGSDSKTRSPDLPIIIGSSGMRSGSGPNLPIIIGSSGRLPGAGSTGSRSASGGSTGSATAGITGIVDKDIPATGQERQYEKPVSSEATFRCPHPRGLYPNALDCGRFWLCREYKPSLLKCPAGQLFDLASLACVEPDKAQCSSISPRT